ncbi:EGF-like repeat and discoidin I-like domain-containing protein 3 [Actinia tenebrosa]|uniref:EGF-like repeat and discoidin I-like domain-containing protein 3 n=1 Tax=Actinia tenebrosa TaxID=6105 RepID=A0A6P8IB48_ACTTE|nr:EGF-like repeat and discoidin I-like domain-containing protein 3 [Actinia tenebrosa]
MAFESEITFLSLLVSFFIRFCESGCSEGLYFDKLPFRKFQLGNVIQTIFVEDEIDCFITCSRLPKCLSMNIADQKKQDGLLECILLRELAMPSSGLFMLSQIYHYYFRRFGEGMCATPRCKNGGVCITLVNDYRCHCRQTFAGKECELNLSCNASSALGMEDGTIPDQQLTASTTYDGRYLPAYGRLNFKANVSYNSGSWAPKTLDFNQWFQVDLGSVAKVTGVATQGNPIYATWITSYGLQYSVDNSHYEDYEKGKIFSGNSDQNTVVKNNVNPAIIARYIRIRPKTWYRYIRTRVELYGCK